MPLSDRSCACGCSLPMEGKHHAAYYASDACRARDWKRRNGYGPQAPRKSRANGSPRKARPSDVRISFPKAVEAIAAALDKHAPWHPPNQGTAERWLREALTDKQRARLDDAA